MNRQEKTRRVYSVLYDSDRNDGLSDDIAHFSTLSRALEFAKGKTHYGNPADVDADDVPERICRRWAIN